MRHRFEVVVALKAGLADPQGKAIEDAAPTMGWEGVESVRVGKHIEVTIEADDEGSARTLVEDMATRLLSNPVIEDVRIRSTEEVP